MVKKPGGPISRRASLASRLSTRTARISPAGGVSSLPYARAFADWLQAQLAAVDTDALVRYRDVAPAAVRAHPTEEHFLPLFVAWGAAGKHPVAERILEGLEAGALSMDSYAFHSGKASTGSDATRHAASVR